MSTEQPMHNTGPGTELALPFTLPEQKFVQIFQAVHHVGEQEARLKFQTELFNFTKGLTDKSTPDNDLLKCTEITIKAVFLDVIGSGLSFSPTSKHVFLMSRNTKVPSGYEKRLYFQPAPDGKVFLCQRVNSLERLTPPQMVYEGDTFEYWTDGEKTQVSHRPKLPRTGKRIIAGYCFQVFPDGSKNAVVLDDMEVERRKGYSEIQNGKNVQDPNTGRYGKVRGAANALYTSFNGGIDPGFFGAKIVDAATKGLRRAEINSTQVLEGDPEIEATEDINYSVVNDTTAPEYYPTEPDINEPQKPLF